MSQLESLFVESPLPRADLLLNLGMFAQGSLLAKFLVMNDIYERIKDIPGALIEFGVGWGQNLVLLENLRTIHEPFNQQRMIVGFDTFAGYDREYLANLLAAHEASNPLGRARGNHRLIDGDAEVTAPRYFKDHPETIVAMACFDIGVYPPTKAALEAVVPALVPGSVLVFDELTGAGATGDAIAFKEVLGGASFKIEKSRHYPSKAIVTMK